MKLALASVCIAAALALSGCVSKSAEPPADLDQGLSPTGTSDGLNNTTNAIVHKPPVARMQIFDVGGALVYEANFVADNGTSGGAVKGGAPVTFLGSGSEAVDKTATLTSWAWEFGDGGRATGRGASHAFADTGGVFKVKLTVTDSYGGTDVQVVTLPVMATKTLALPVAFTGAAQVGTASVADQAGQAALDTVTHTLELPSQLNGYHVKVVGLKLNLTPGEPTSDFDLFVLDADGAEVGSSAHQGSPGTPESLDLDASQISNGTYTVKTVLYLGANGTYKIDGEALFLVVNDQVAAAMGGGH